MNTATAGYKARLHTNWHYQQAVRAIDGTLLSVTSDSTASRVVSAPNRRPVWLRATIIQDDETVLLTWRTTNGVEVARPMRLAIDMNLPAMLAAVAAAEVNY
jgi:hypothetical protein